MLIFNFIDIGDVSEGDAPIVGYAAVRIFVFLPRVHLKQEHC